MKTQKDKIIEILTDMDVKPSYAPTIAQGDTTPMVTRLNHIGQFRKLIATRILSETRTLSESKVHDILTEKFPDYNVPYCCDVAEQICSLAIPEQPAMSEDEIEQSFKDWLGWNNKPRPDEDDPDYYTYSWGMNVWYNAYKYYKTK